jgi:hypothetical protein
VGPGSVVPHATDGPGRQTEPGSRQVADTLGISTGSVKTHAFRGLARLRATGHGGPLAHPGSLPAPRSARPSGKRGRGRGGLTLS